MGNFVFLNLFLAILLDGFGNSDILADQQETDNELKELDIIYKEKMDEETKRRRNQKRELMENE